MVTSVISYQSHKLFQHRILVLFPLASSEGSDESVHLCDKLPISQTVSAQDFGTFCISEQ